MAYFTTSLAADGTAVIATLDRRRDSNNWNGTFFIHGTFGSGTLVIQASPDGGTTKVALKDFTGNAISATSAAVFNSQPMGNTNINTKQITLYAVLSGSTNPVLSVDLFDNR